MNDRCYVEPLEKTATSEERAETQWTILAVWGMGCPNCVARVRNSLLRVHGVVGAEVDLLSSAAYLIYNPSLTDIPALLEAVAQAGGDGRHEYRAMHIG